MVKKSLPFFIILFSIFYLFLRINTSIYSYKPAVEPLCNLNIPQTISFSNTSVVLKLKAGEVKGNDWTTYDDAVSWHINSGSNLCDKGNIVMWAHNRKGLFAELYNVSTGEIVSVAGEEGIRKYRIVDIRDVVSTDLTLVKVDDDRLTLYTCDGFLDSKRRFVIAKPV